MTRVFGVLRSNWSLMLRLVMGSLLIGVALELPVQALRYAGAIKAVPGLVLVLLSSIYASYAYGRRRDRADGLIGAVFAGIVQATFFGGLAALVLAVQRLPMIKLPFVVAGLALTANWAAVAERRFGRGSRA